MKRLLGLILCLCLFVSGCGAARNITIGETRNKVNQLEVGMTKDEVIELLGKPHKREASKGNEYLFYRTEWAFEGLLTLESIPLDRELTPIVLIGGKVDGWGWDYYQELKGQR